MKPRAKVINLFLNDGTLKGLINVSDSSWTLNGELYASPRETIDDLLRDDACNRYGVYLLLSPDKVYVGQSTNLRNRIEQHILGKDWWDRAILLTTKDDGLNRSDIDYLESYLIQKANDCNTLDNDNKNKGNKRKLDRFREEIMNQYLDEALFILELIGIEVFSEVKKDTFIPNLPVKSDKEIEIRAKSEAINFVEKNGIKLSKYRSFARLQEKKNTFWINPSQTYTEKDWNLILNNQTERKIIVLFVPPNTFEKTFESKQGKLIIRRDRQIYLDINIDAKTLIDERSNCSFKPFVIKELFY